MTPARLINRTPAALLAAAFTAGFVAAPPAQGQVQVQNGGAHDANQQTGSGGYNAAVDQPDYRARNLLITGNVGGGRAFRGDINYNAPGEFQGSLGSDNLFNFRRDSIYSNPGANNYAAQGLGDRVIVTRPTTALPNYQGGYSAAQYNRAQYNPQGGVLSYRQDGGGFVSISGLVDPSRVNSGGRSLGLIQTPRGTVSIDASPLTGIRYNPLDVNTGATTRPDQAPEPNQGFNPLENRPGYDDLTPDEEDTTTDPSLTPDRRIDGTYRPAEIDYGLEGGNLREDPLAIRLGSQVQSALALQLSGRTDNNIPNTQAQAIRSQVFGPTAGVDRPEAPTAPTAPEAPTAPQNPYEKLIADIMARAEPNNPFTDRPQDPEGEEGEQGEGVNNWQSILDKPDDEELEDKRKAREKMKRIALGLIDEDGNVDFDTPLPSIQDDSELGKLLAELDYDLPRMRSLTDDSGTRINKLMKRGEQELNAGRYLAAENVYRQVLRENREDALAKAGLVHSQMGAGMIRSAAFNLRDLFANHPELIALRYDTKLMPESDRLRWLQGRLQKMIGEDTRGADPGIVLAYLGYQLEAKPLIEYGLDVAETAAPRDPLMPLLRRIWLEEKQ